MSINYKEQFNQSEAKHKKIYTHFLHLDSATTKSNFKQNAESFNNQLDDIQIKSCIQEIHSKDQDVGINSILTLCKYIASNPSEVIFNLSINDLIVFFDYVRNLRTQNQVLSAICFILQFTHDNFLVQELIARIEFYSHIRILIETPTDVKTQSIAICCALYSLEVGPILINRMIENEIFDVLMKANMTSNFSEYLRASFFKVAIKKYDNDNIEEFLQKTINFLIKLCKSTTSSRITVSECVRALDISLSKSIYSFQLIDSNHMFDSIMEYLHDGKEPKLRKAAATFIFSIVQSPMFSMETLENYNLIQNLLNIATFNDVPLFLICLSIIQFILQEPEEFDVHRVIDHIVNYNFSNSLADANYNIKISLLSTLQLVVFNSTYDQVFTLFSNGMIFFLGDLINTGDRDVSTDIAHILSMALNINVDIAFINEITKALYESGAIEQFNTLINDPSNPPRNIEFILELLQKLPSPDILF